MDIPLELGGVYKTKWDARPIRILLFDETEVFYDCYWSESGWGFKNLKKAIYYRVPTLMFINDSKKIAVEPLTEDEAALYRPNLPLRICRVKDFNWQKEQFLDVNDLSKYNLPKEFSVKSLLAKEIVLKPCDFKGKLKKGEVIKASGEEFTYNELIYYANNINYTQYSESSNGIGIYRLGVEKGRPSYYIGNFYDNAGNIKYYEDINNN